MKSVRKNLIYNSAFQIILLLIPLITTPYVARVVGTDNVGKYSFATSMVTYFSVLACLGSTVYGQRLVAYKRDNKQELTTAFWEIFSFRAISSVLFLVLYFLYLKVFSEFNLLTIVVSLNIVNVITDVTWFYQGIEEFKKTILNSVIVRLISLVCIFTFVKKEEDVWLYALIFFGSFIVGNLILWFPLKRWIGPPDAFHPLRHLKGMFLVFLPTIASQVYTILDKSMIGWITRSDYANGCYEQSEKLARAALTVVTAIGAVIAPRIANLYHKGEMEPAKGLLYKSYRIVWALGFPIAIGLLAVSDQLIPVYLGAGYDMSIPLLNVFSLLVIFVSLAYVTGISYLTPTSQQNVYTVSVVVAAIVNFIMNSMMISRFGAMGAAIASVTAEAIGVIIQIGYCVYKKQLSLKAIFSSAYRYLLAAGVMFAAVVLLKQQLETKVSSLVLLVATGGIVYFLALLAMRDSLLLEGLQTVKKKLRIGAN